MGSIGDVLQGVGLFLCIGGLLLVGAIFLIGRALTGNRNRTGGTLGQPYDPTGTSNVDPVLRERGNERPTYDSRRVESSGGFGNEGGIPQTGGPFDRNLDNEFERGINTGGPLRGTLDDQPDYGDLRDTGDDRPRRTRDRDDDDIRSGGGFGGR
jgi:hypothetical protein